MNSDFASSSCSSAFVLNPLPSPLLRTLCENCSFSFPMPMIFSYSSDHFYYTQIHHSASRLIIRGTFFLRPWLATHFCTTANPKPTETRLLWSLVVSSRFLWSPLRGIFQILDCSEAPVIRLQRQLYEAHNIILLCTL